MFRTGFLSTKTPDEGQKTCLKHAEFYSKNKFDELVYLVGFIIRMHHDAWSCECQPLLHSDTQANFSLC